MKIIDISVTISNQMVIFPGDPPVVIDPISKIEWGNKANLSSIYLGSHTGTHLDAPLHLFRKGKSINRFNLDRLVGKAKIFDLRDRVRISAKDLEAYKINSGDKILFKTDNSELWEKDRFDPNFVFLTHAAAEYLVKKKVGLIGIDYLSVEKYKSRTCPVHNLLLGNEILILEGLNLSQVNEGEYFLVCLPLKVTGIDGSPARTILIEKKNV